VWGDHVFLNVSDGRTLSLWAVDRNRGAALWKQPLGGGDTRMMKQNMSSPSPVTDGRIVWVMTGTGILKAFDFAGKELWMRDLQREYGRFGLQWGYGSSPLLHEDGLYVQVLHGMHTKDPSYLLRIDKATGKTVWDRTTVWDMLRNPAYVGSAGYGKTRAGPLRPRLRAQRGRALQPRRAAAHLGGRALRRLGRAEG
jgi:outer membrane protein assembly factor BamB